MLHVYRYSEGGWSAESKCRMHFLVLCKSLSDFVRWCLFTLTDTPTEFPRVHYGEMKLDVAAAALMTQSWMDDYCLAPV